MFNRNIMDIGYTLLIVLCGFGAGTIWGVLLEGRSWKRKLTKEIAPGSFPTNSKVCHKAKISIFHENKNVDIKLIEGSTKLLKKF